MLFKHIYSIQMMCKVLKLNLSTVYKVMHYKLSYQDIDRLDLESRLIDLINEFDYIYGAPILTRKLGKQGYITTIKRVSKYMKRLGLRSVTVKKHILVHHLKHPMVNRI